MPKKMVPEVWILGPDREQLIPVEVKDTEDGMVEFTFPPLSSLLRDDEHLSVHWIEVESD